MNNKFWSGKRVLVTGHTGFKGSWLCLWLQSLGAKVSGLSLAPASDPNLFELLKLDHDQPGGFVDVRDSAAVERQLRSCDPEIVFHLAAQSLVRYSYAHPLETFATNIMGTANVLEASRRCAAVRAIVVVTSDKCYENKESNRGYRETDPLAGFDPYSSSKSCAEIVSAAYRNSYFHPERYAEHHVGVATARAGNVFGGGDCATDRLVPDLFAAFLANTPATIRNPSAVRPWQHVLEPLSGYLDLAEKLFSDGAKFAEAFNFGPYEQDCRPVGDVARALANLWGKSAAFTTTATDSPNQKPHETTCLKLDSTKADHALNWRPRWRLDQALEKTVAWYKAYATAPETIRELSLQQIHDYSQSPKIDRLPTGR